MDNLAKMKKSELKDFFIKKIVEAETLLAWYDEHNMRYLIDALIIDSNYLENRSYKNPQDVGHKFMDKAIYSNEITKIKKLINQLEEVRIEFEKGNLNQDKETTNIEFDKSNQIQSKRGGKREGAGRKALGVTKKVSLTLSEETWEAIEKLCKDEGLKQSKVLRDIIEGNMKS